MGCFVGTRRRVARGSTAFVAALFFCGMTAGFLCAADQIQPSTTSVSAIPPTPTAASADQFQTSTTTVSVAPPVPATVSAEQPQVSTATAPVGHHITISRSQEVSVSGAELIGASTCLSCHENQEHFKDTVHAKSFAQVKNIAFEQSCETCHGPGSLHAAAAGDKSNPGFATIKDFKGMSAIELGKTCLQCHEDEKRMHWVGSVHERRDVSCLACHSVHNAQEEKLLLVKPTIEGVCNQCHQDIVAKTRRSAHMPLPEGKMDCSSCHNPHGSSTSKMLNQESVNATCYPCHADKRGPFLWEHPPVREDCLNCHDPHGTHNDYMLVAREPFLCQRCHIRLAGHASTAYGQSQINGASSSNKILGGSCTNCHTNVHGSNSPSGTFFFR